MTQAVAEVEVFSEVKSASTPKHTTDKKSPIAGAKCELVMLYYRDLYEKHTHIIKCD